MERRGGERRREEDCNCIVAVVAKVLLAKKKKNPCQATREGGRTESLRMDGGKGENLFLLLLSVLACLTACLLSYSYVRTSE